MKKNMSDEPNEPENEPEIEGKPASAWGWYIAGFMYLVAVFVVVVWNALRVKPQYDAMVDAVRAQAGDKYGAILIVAAWVILAPFLVALDKATTVSHRYRRARGMATEGEIKNRERGDQTRTALIVIVIIAIGYGVYTAITGGW